MSATREMKREKTLQIKKQLLAALCCFWVGWATAQSPVIQPPPAVQQALNQDPAWAKAYAEGLALWRSKQWRDSAKAWETLFEKVRARLGDEHIATGWAALYLGDSYQGQGLHEKALALLKDAARLHERDVGEHPSTALAFERLGDMHRTLEQHQQALAWRERALSVYGKTSGPDQPETILAMSNVAQSQGDLLQHEQALALYARALAAIEKTQGPLHSHTGNVLVSYAETLLGTGQIDVALSLQLRALAIFEANLGPEHYDTAAILNNLGNTHIYLAQYDKAMAYLQRALSITEKNLGLEHPDTAMVLHNIAGVYRYLGQTEKALVFQQRSLNVLENVWGPDHPNVARGLASLATDYVALAQYEKALAFQKRALTIFEKSLGPDHPGTARVLNDLALTYSALAQHAEALPLKKRSLAIVQKLLGPDHPLNATTLGNLALTLNALAQYDNALTLNRRALAITEKSLGPDHPDTALRLNNLAENHSALAQHDQALALKQRALVITEKVLGPDHPDTERSLNNLASTHITLAQYDKALPLQQRALAISEKIYGTAHPATARILNNLASTYGALGQHAKALALQERSLAIYEKVLGPEHPDTALSLNELAQTYAHLAHHNKALLLQQRALVIYENVFGPDHPGTARGLNDLASTYSALAQRAKALPLQERSLAIIEKIVGPDHPTTATTLNNLALTFSDLAQHKRALPLLERALTITEKALGSDHPDTAKRMNNFAFILERLNHPEAAIVFLKSAVNIYQTQRERVSGVGTAELKSYTQSVSRVYQSLANALTDQGRLAEAQMVLDMLKEDEQFEFIRRSASADPRRTRMGYNATEQAWVNRYRQVADRLAALGAEEVALQKKAKLGLSPEQQARQKALAADLAVARAAFDAYLTELRTSFAQKGPARAVEVVETSQQALRETQDLLKGLGDDVVLLQYYMTDDKVGMLLTTPGVQLARTSAVNAKDLSRQIAEFRRLLRDPKSAVQPAAQALYQLLVAPVAQDLVQAGAKTVMLSLDGALRYVPFAALHDGQQYLAQRWNLPMYTSVARGKLRDAVSTEWQAAGLGLTRAVGEFDALPAVKAEMSSIVKSGRSGVLPGEVFLDQAFSAARLKDVSQRPFQLLHVASHFRFSPGTEVNSFLLLGDGQQLTLGDIRTQNYRFDNVDLLTLSACDTGLGGGRDAQGREIEGFGVIAQQQGAKAVLATLWPVADQSTAVLMADLYKQRQSKRLSKIEALRQAQLGLLAQPRYAHPFYWAPFILMGNWK